MEIRHSRRAILTTTAKGTAGAGAAIAMLGMFGVSPARAEQHLRDVERGKRLQAGMSNAGLQSNWCTQGKQTSEYWGSVLGVDVHWYDGQLDPSRQRAAIDDMSTKHWDFVAIQTVSIGTLIQPVNRMIAAGIPVIGMDTLIAKLSSINLHTYIAPDNDFMGAASTEAIIKAIGGRGNIVMTWGQYGHTGAQGRARGFYATVKKYPGIKVLAVDSGYWDQVKTQALWEGWMSKYGSRINAAFFHSDQMAVAGLQVIRNHGLAGHIKVSGVDAMPDAINLVLKGQMTATVRNPSCRIHAYSVFAGVAAVLNGERTGSGIPKYIVADGPVVDKVNGPGMLWMEKHYLL